MKYLDRMMSFYDSDWPVVDRNLQREQRELVLSTVFLSFVPIGLLHYNIWEVLIGVGSVCDYLWVRVVGYHPPHNVGDGEYT